jgi:hypothetical protein
MPVAPSSVEAGHGSDESAGHAQAGTAVPSSMTAWSTGWRCGCGLSPDRDWNSDKPRSSYATAGNGLFASTVISMVRLEGKDGS